MKCALYNCHNFYFVNERIVYLVLIVYANPHMCNASDFVNIASALILFEFWWNMTLQVDRHGRILMQISNPLFQ